MVHFLAEDEKHFLPFFSVAIIVTQLVTTFRDQDTLFMAFVACCAAILCRNYPALTEQLL